MGNGTITNGAVWRFHISARKASALVAARLAKLLARDSFCEMPERPACFVSTRVLLEGNPAAISLFCFLMP